MEKLFIRDDDFVVCWSDDGRHGWSLHAPGSTDREIAEGDAPALASGIGKRIPQRAYREAAERVATWASDVIKVNGGYLAFESAADAATWRNQK